MDDLLIKPKAEAFRAQQLAKIDAEALDVAARFCEADKSNPDFVRKALAAKLVEEGQAPRLDNQMSSALNEFSSNIVKECVPNGQLKPFPWNNLSLMTATGAKGSQVNYSQISCLLGQQALEGRRVPFMASGKTLPCFDPYDPAARAGGYVSQRFLTGLRPQEFYFHCMAGREGLIDTAVKTSRSGYLQRCLIKHLEGLVVQYDQTVRDHDGSIVMFQYGEDNIDVLESAFLEQFGFVLKNFEASKAKLLAGHEHLISEKKMKKMMKYLDRAQKHPEMYDPLSSRTGSSKLGHVSERFWEQLSLFCEKKKKSFVKRKINLTEFKTLMFFKYRKSQVHPGEVVGLLAAQSVGEPSTQMTLNTFHAAGRNEANVTLGIPRLREVLMTASKQIATPSMTLHLNNPTSMEDAQHLMTKLYRLVLRELISGIVCNEVYLIEPHSELGIARTDTPQDSGTTRSVSSLNTMLTCCWSATV
jgi:DNA-directed RNA polymerase I subunit RPA1